MALDFEKIKREKFIDNNARVLRAVNTLHTRFVKIKDLEYGLAPDISAAEISDSINYLVESGYIKLRNIESRAEVSDLADAEILNLEAKLTAKGIAFLTGKLSDPCIRR